MKKATCVYLNKQDIKNAFKQCGFDVTVDADMGVLYIYFKKDDDEMRFYDTYNGYEDVISKYVGENVGFIIARDEDMLIPSAFVAFLK